MDAKLYVILGSHACRTGMLLLEHKGIAYERVELPTGMHPFAAAAARLLRATGRRSRARRRAPADARAADRWGRCRRCASTASA